ncbi:MAG: hypothetical protein WKF78_13300 [Candidatus Limnocylindrales bacterium]
MNRIRHAYREMVPGLEPYFVSGFHDDARGVLATYGDVSPSVVRNMIHGLGTSIGMISTIDAMIFGALCASIGLGLGLAIEVELVLAITGFAVAFGLLTVVGMRTAIGRQARAESRFPTPD